MERVTLHSEGTPLCSFKSAASVPIRSLKAHFTPIQNGSGDPSPSNVREIVGRTGLNINRSKVNLIPENIKFISAKLKPYTNGSDAIISGSVYNVMYFEIPIGTFYCVRDDGNKSVSYVALSDEPPAVGVQTYNVITATNRYAITIDNTDGHRYLIIFGLNSYETAIEGIRDVHLRFVSSLYDQYEDPSAVLTSVIFPSSSKNMIDISTGWTSPAYYEENTGRSMTGKGKRDNKYIAVIPGNTYTMSWATWGYNMRVVFYRINDIGSKIATRTLDSTSNSGFTFTIADNEHYIRICQYTGSYTDLPANLQLEAGSTATAYKEYSSDNTFYGGYIDPIKGIIAKTYTNIDLGTLTWNTYVNPSGNNIFYAPLPNAAGNIVNGRRANCDHYKRYIGNNHWYQNIADKEFVSQASGVSSSIRVWIRDDDYADAASFAEAMNGVILCYQIETPIEYPLDSTSLSTIEGLNHYWSSSGNGVEVDYDLYESKMIQDAKRRMLANNQPHLETQTGKIVTFTPQVRAPIKELKCNFTPIQDLHGYDHPWPAGGNDNIFHFSVADSGTTWSDNFGYSAISVNDDSITFNGTATSEHQISIGNNDVSIPAGAHYICTTSDDVGIQIIYNGSIVLSTAYGSTGAVLSMGITLPSSNTSFRIIVKSGASFNNEKVGFMIRKDSGETAEWTPYMNVCPIEGRTEANVYRTNKSIVEFLASSFTNINSTQYNGNVGWCNELHFVDPYYGQTVTYSVDFDATNATSNNNAARIWAKDKAGNWKYLATSGNRIAAGSTGKSKVTVDITDDIDWIVFGLWLQPGATASNPMVEFGSTNTEYEEQIKTIIPVEFPATKNLFDQSQLLQASGFSLNSDGYYTGTWGQFNLAFGSGFPKQPAFQPNTRYTLSLKGYTNSDTTNRVIFDFVYTDGTRDRLSIIGITPTVYTMVSNASKTVELISGTFGSGAENLIYLKDIQVEAGVKATAYEPYGIAYGGYVDLLSGSMIVEWNAEVLDGSRRYYVSSNNYMGINFTDCWTTLPASNYRTQVALSVYAVPDSIADCLATVAGDYSIWSRPDSFPWSTTINPSSDTQFHITLGNTEIGADSSDTREQRAAKIKAYLGAHPITIVYKLATPITYQLTPTQLKAFKTSNNIWSDTNGNTTVKYWTH